VLAEHRRVPYLVVDRQPNEPAEQQAVVQFFHPQPFTPLAIQCLQQQRSQQLFRRNRRAPGAGIQIIEVPRQFVQSLVHHLANRPQGVIAWHSLF
jgi:hypothetical protein